MRVWGALWRRKRALRPTAANPAPTPRVTGMEFSPGAVGAGLDPQVWCPDSERRDSADSRPRKGAARAQDSDSQAPQAVARLCPARPGAPTQDKALKIAPARSRQQEGTFLFLMCKKCFASRREHNRCKFQHTGPLPRAPTAIAASRPRRGHGLPDPDLGTASAPSGRPAPDPAGLEGRNGRRGGPKEVGVAGRGRGQARAAGLEGARRGQSHPGALSPGPPGLASPHVAGRTVPHVEWAEEEGGRGRAGVRPAAAGPPPLPPRPPRFPRASRAGPGRECPLRRSPSPARHACVHFLGATNPRREPICSEE